MAKPRLDLFLILKHLDMQDFTVYDQLADDPELIKELDTQLGWLIPQWMTGGVTEQGHRAMIQKFDDTCNTVWGSLKNDPRMRAKLLAACGMGHPMKHKFTKPKGIKKNDPLYNMVLEVYPDARPEEVKLFLKGAGPEEVVDLCKSLGYQKDEIDKIEKLLG